MSERLPNFNFLSYRRFVSFFGFGALLVTGGGQNDEVTSDYHTTKDPKSIALGNEATAVISVEKHDGYQATGTITLTPKNGEVSISTFALQKGQSLDLTGEKKLYHDFRKK